MMNYPISAADAPAVNDGTQILNGDHAEKAGFGLSNGMAPDFPGSTGRIRIAP